MEWMILIIQVLIYWKVCALKRSFDLSQRQKLVGERTNGFLRGGE